MSALSLISCLKFRFLCFPPRLSENIRPVKSTQSGNVNLRRRRRKPEDPVGTKREGFTAWMEATTTSPPHHLPPEILDHILDLLHDNPRALRRCCLVSKSWVPRARKHLFSDIEFDSIKDLNRWQQAFPDPVNSPAHFTRTLTVMWGSILITKESGQWVQPFSRVEQLILDSTRVIFRNTTDLSPFRDFAPFPKSFFASTPYLLHSQIFDLVRFLLVLEDLTLICKDLSDSDGSSIPSTMTSTSPPFTGTLSVSADYGLARILRLVLDLPGGVRFRTLELLPCGEPELPLVTELVSACSDTLEHLDIGSEIYGTLTYFPSLYHLV